MTMIFILYYGLCKDDGERIMPPDALFQDDNVLLILKVEE